VLLGLDERTAPLQAILRGLQNPETLPDLNATPTLNMPRRLASMVSQLAAMRH
jgi:hypothetical protein